MLNFEFARQWGHMILEKNLFVPVNSIKTGRLTKLVMSSLQSSLICAGNLFD